MGRLAKWPVCGLLVIASGTAGAQSGKVEPITVSVQPVSPSVVASIAMRAKHPELLVLWRGQPKWFLRSGKNASHGSNTNEVINQSLDYGDLHLEWAYEKSGRTIRVGATSTTLSPNDNVVLIDSVDAPGGAKVAGLAHLEFADDLSRATFASVFKQSASVVAFLRCDAGMADAGSQRLNSLACDELALK